MKKLLLPLLMLFHQAVLADDETLIECRQIEAIEERVACYDAVVDSYRTLGTTIAIEQVEQIEATVTDVRESASNKLTVTLDNGQVWRQLDNKTLRLKNGEAVIVRKASLGSFLLEKESGSRSIRVKRVN
jgi:hypothetical protein